MSASSAHSPDSSSRRRRPAEPTPGERADGLSVCGSVMDAPAKTLHRYSTSISCLMGVCQTRSPSQVWQRTLKVSRAVSTVSCLVSMTNGVLRMNKSVSTIRSGGSWGEPGSAFFSLPLFSCILYLCQSEIFWHTVIGEKRSHANLHRHVHKVLLS